MGYWYEFMLDPPEWLVAVLEDLELLEAQSEQSKLGFI
jgi:hypothetical protein